MRALIIGAVLLAGCGDDSGAPHDAAVDTVDAAPPATELVAVIRATPNRDLDLLFVIDDSSAMNVKQANLVAAFPKLLEVLQALPGGMPNLHLGVVTSDLGTFSSEDAMPATAVNGCTGRGKGGEMQTFGAPVTGAFLIDTDDGAGGRTRNYTGELTDVLGQMASAGQDGCGFEQSLSAMKVALADNPANAGFLRPSAMLGVVFLTDEDDCSVRHGSLFGPEIPELGALSGFRCVRFGVTCAVGGATATDMNTAGVKSGCTGSQDSLYLPDVASFRDFLVGLKADTRDVVVAAITPPTTPFEVKLFSDAPNPPIPPRQIPGLATSCSYQEANGMTTTGSPAARMQQLLTLFPDASVSSTICTRDLTGVAGRIGNLVSRGVGAPCIDHAIASSASCTVADRVGAATTEIPKCGSPPCWHLEADATRCPLADHQKLVVDRAQAADPATVTEMRCPP